MQKKTKLLRLEEKTGNNKVVNAYLSCDSRPDFKRVVVRAADNAVATKLEAGDHVVIMTFQHLWDGADKERCNKTDVEEEGK